MKKLFLLPVFVLSFCTLMAQPPAGKAKPGDTYGDASGISEKIVQVESIRKGEILTGTFTGVPTEVCSKKGCWVQLSLEDGKTATIKMKDYGFFVPTALVGKKILIDGVAEIKITSVDELKHLAEDGNKSQEEIDAITEPKETITILANGIKVAG